jgi:metal-responsive CopG/Arc/MetJ family transcriptional regulator
MKTAISIPNEVFEAAEALAERLHVSRSELYARAVAAYLKQYSAEEVTQQLDAVYSEEESRLDRVAEAIQHFSLDKETW